MMYFLLMKYLLPIKQKSYPLHGGKGNLLISQVVNFSSSATKILYSFPLIFYH